MSEELKNPVLKNTQTGQIVELITSPFTIGRALGCDYVTENKITSRKHCKLTKTEHGWTVTDLSTNGTLINDTIHIKNSQTSEPLQHRDIINIGELWEFLSKPEPPESVRTIDSSPLSSPSFDENGVSDEFLLNLVDGVEEGLDKSEATNTTKSNLEPATTNEPSTESKVPVTASNSIESNIPPVPNEQNADNPVSLPQISNLTSTSYTNNIVDETLQGANVLPTTNSQTESQTIVLSSNLIPSSSNIATEAYISPENSHKKLKIVTNVTVPSQTTKIASKVIQVRKLTPEQVKALKGSGKCLVLRPPATTSTTSSSSEVPGPSVTSSNVVVPGSVIDITNIPIVFGDNTILSGNTPNVPTTSIEKITPNSFVIHATSSETIPLENTTSTNIVPIPVTNVPVAVSEIVVETSNDISKTRVHDSQEPGPSKQTKLQSRYEEEMEDELLCTICSNLFIKTVTLGCSHSFCQYCIETWKKKKSDCPICRNKITSTIRTLVLDNLIEKMIENGSDEIKRTRKQALEERNKIEKEIEEKNNKTANKRKNTARRGRGPNRERGSDRTQPITRQNSTDNQTNQATSSNNAPVVQAPPPAAYITIADSPSTTDSEEDYDFEGWQDDYYEDAWYNGRPGAYYGGYGSCYICGDGGHWANGCPYRS